jgi:ABC-type uncharacterized transport system involved in gliding motility auxiliary subunit
MNKTIQKIAFIAGIILIITGLIVYSIYPMIIGGPITSIVGLLIVIAYVYYNWADIKDSISVRSAKYGTNTVIFIFVVLCIVLLLNILGKNYRLKYDATTAKVNTLSQQTKNIIKNLKKPMEIIGFIPSKDATSKATFMDFCDSYTYISGGKIQCKIIDPNKNPGLAKKFHIITGGKIVYGIQNEDDYTRAEFLSEEDLTSAIIRLTSNIKKVIYFTSGHGEGDITSDKQDQYNKLQIKLTDIGYKTDVMYPNFKNIPQDCTVLVIVGPTSEFMTQEIEAIEAYLNKGGSALILIDPLTKTGLEDMLVKWGLIIHDTIVVDYFSNMNDNPLIPVIAKYTVKHPIIISESGSVIPLTFFTLARSMRYMSKLIPDVTFSPLLTTTGGSNYSYGETNLKAYKEKSEYEYNRNEDLNGPLALAFVLTKNIHTEKENDSEAKADNKQETKKDKEKPLQGKIVVIGDSNFVNNASIDYYGNSVLALNSINWLSGDDELISIERPTTKPNIISLTNQQKKLIYYICVILLPGIMFFTGILIWWKRRKG